MFENLDISTTCRNSLYPTRLETKTKISFLDSLKGDGKKMVKRERFGFFGRNARSPGTQPLPHSSRFARFANSSLICRKEARFVVGEQRGSQRLVRERKVSKQGRRRGTVWRPTTSANDVWEWDENGEMYPLDFLDGATGEGREKERSTRSR